MRKMIMVVALAIAAVSGVQAQMGATGSSGTAAGSQQSPAKALDMLLGMQEHEMMGVANAMPADKFDFAPTTAMIPGSKFDGVRSFSAQARHVAQANYYFASVVSGMKLTVDMRAIGAMKSKDEVVKALAGSYAALRQANATLTEKNSFEVVKSEDGDFTRSTMAAFAVAHAYDHYGQMVEYLRMNGLIPPSSAK